MEVKINKEIREYSENMFFGLTLRQFFFSALGCAAAVGIYFLCRDALGLEFTTWLCVLGVIPFAAAGFLRYNGMPAEKFIAAYVKSRFIFPSVKTESHGLVLHGFLEVLIIRFGIQIS